MIFRAPKLAAALAGSVLATAAFAQQAASPAAPFEPPGRLVVAWESPPPAQTGWLQMFAVRPPYAPLQPPMEIDPAAVVRYAGGRLYVVAGAAHRSGGRITVVDPRAWAALDAFDLGAAAPPRDIAVVSRRRAYVTRAGAGRLLRLDLATGQAVESVDLSPLAAPDGAVDMGMMAVHDGLLFVQVRRGLALPAYIAVVELATETLLDVDPQRPGLQAIELQGTAPQLKMQLMPSAHRLFVSATGEFHDDGGIEAIDLHALQSLGLVAAEQGGDAFGAQVGAFRMLSATHGYLTFSTDLALSSHTFGFSQAGGMELDHWLEPDSLHYFVPHLPYDAATDTIFVPMLAGEQTGVNAFRAETAEPLSDVPIPTTGPISDLIVIPNLPEAQSANRRRRRAAAAVETMRVRRAGDLGGPWAPGGQSQKRADG